MSFVTIHKSGTGGDKFVVDSYYNGGAYNFSFGGDGSCLRNIFLQGDDAAEIRKEFDLWRNVEPKKPYRDIWLSLIDLYL